VQDLHELIFDSVESILQQSYSNFELLIIGNSKISYQYKDPRIRHIKAARDTDFATLLNRGIKFAKGKYLIITSEILLFEKHRIYNQVKFLENKNNADIAAVGSYLFLIDKNKVPVSLIQFPLYNQEIQATFLFRNPISTSAAMFRTRIVNKYKLSKKYHKIGEYDFWIKFSNKYKLANLPEFLTYRFLSDKEDFNNSIKEALGTILCKELEKLFDISSQELTIHFAIFGGYMQNYFNTKTKIIDLKIWIDKILRALQSKYQLSNKLINEFKSVILENYCGIISIQ
jgi:glycosyltransferase involved in cell wall biosynthesis